MTRKKLTLHDYANKFGLTIEEEILYSLYLTEDEDGENRYITGNKRQINYYLMGVEEYKYRGQPRLEIPEELSFWSEKSNQSLSGDAFGTLAEICGYNVYHFINLDRIYICSRDEKVENPITDSVMSGDREEMCYFMSGFIDCAKGHIIIPEERRREDENENN